MSSNDAFFVLVIIYLFTLTPYIQPYLTKTAFLYLARIHVEIYLFVLNDFVFNKYLGYYICAY